MARTIALLISSKPLDPSPLSLSLLSAFLLLSIVALVSALCASHHRKSRPTSPLPTSTSSSNPATHGPIAPTEPVLRSMTPRRKLSLSMSLKLPEGLTRVRTVRREDAEKEKAVACEDSTWMKAIILGEKCRVPENGEQEDEESVVYDEKGNVRRNYHPRTPKSMPVSRTNSFIFPSSSS